MASMPLRPQAAGPASVPLFLLGATLFGVRPAAGNWLLQCSSCVDQALYADEALKDNVQDADTSVLLAQIKNIRVREFEHREYEFYNKFFPQRQLGIMARELQTVMPNAVALLPERRWTNAKGVSNATKNVMLLRDSHLLMAALGALQLLAKKADWWDSTIEKLNKEMIEVVAEQNHNRRKREEILEQIVRIIAKVEVLQHTLSKTEESFVKLDADVGQFKAKQEERHVEMSFSLEEMRNRTIAQDEVITKFKEDFRFAVEREARADLVEKRKAAEADMEVALVKRSIEKLRWEEEQKTIQMRADEQRKNEDHSSKLHQEQVAHELEQKKKADLLLMQEQEQSNMRQEEAKQKGEKELLLLRLQSDERRAEMGVQEAIERAKIEEEMKIKERRENEDVHLRAMQAEQAEKRAATLAAIQATAQIAMEWITTFYGNPQNLMLGIGSVVAAIAGAYFAREMAVLLREQLNKRLGRPSLVRTTNRRGLFKETWTALLRLLRLRPPRGSEFSDVVLHPRLHAQVMRLADATHSAKKRRMPLQHVMFYGPPGTGKTMVAQRFAEYSGLEYAIMSGGDVAPLQEQGVTELHKLFKWVHRSRRGVLLFIDEADAFLASRKGGNMSEPMRNALTTMLYHTGTPSSQFMMVLATNRPGDLDSAVLDRVDESVEFGLPDVDAREAMIRLYFSMYITKPLGIRPLRPDEDPYLIPPKKKCKCLERSVPAMTPQGHRLPRDGILSESTLAEVARRLHGFSGREISKLFTSLQTHILFSSAKREVRRWLPKDLVFDVVEQKALEHTRTADFQVSGYDYVNHEENTWKKVDKIDGTKTAAEEPREPQQAQAA